MLDRTIAPPAGEITFGGLPELYADKTTSGVPVYWLNAGGQSVVKIEIVFESGIWYESKKSVSYLTAKMLMEGTKNKTSKEITEGFDSLGAFLEINPGFDDVSIAVYGLKRNFDQVLDLINEIINESIFPEKEFEILRSNRKDQIVLNDSKSNLFASKKLREAIYGSEFTYGQVLTAADIEKVNLEDVKYYNENRLFQSPTIYLSGQVDETLIARVNEKLNFPTSSLFEKSMFEIKSASKDVYVEREGSMQSSIRMAWIAPNKAHPDCYSYQIANSLFGGYFGSRLMKNIREDKGYTYGIHAYPIHLKHSSFGMIAADVVAKHTKDTFAEIRIELDKLLNEPISSEEIEVLTNYLAGSFLASIGTPFEAMVKHKSLIESGLEKDYYYKYFEVLRTIDEATIKSAIEKHFNPDEAYTVVVGLNQ